MVLSPNVIVGKFYIQSMNSTSTGNSLAAARLYIGQTLLHFCISHLGHFGCRCFSSASAKEVMFSPVFVCLSVNRITQKLLVKYFWNFMELLDIIRDKSKRFWVTLTLGCRWSSPAKILHAHDELSRIVPYSIAVYQTAPAYMGSQRTVCVYGVFKI